MNSDNFLETFFTEFVEDFLKGSVKRAVKRFFFIDLINILKNISGKFSQFLLLDKFFLKVS